MEVIVINFVVAYMALATLCLLLNIIFDIFELNSGLEAIGFLFSWPGFILLFVIFFIDKFLKILKNKIKKIILTK